MTTGQLIKAARKRAGLTQMELAEKLGVPYQSVGQWERDIRNPKYESLYRIAAALDTSISFLLGHGDDYLSSRLQKEFLGVFCERVSAEIEKYSPADVLEVFGCTDPLKEVFNGSDTLTLSKAEDIAETLGVSFDYLIGRTNDPLKPNETKHIVNTDREEVIIAEAALLESIRQICGEERFSKKYVAKIIAIQEYIEDSQSILEKILSTIPADQK